MPSRREELNALATYRGNPYGLGGICCVSLSVYVGCMAECACSSSATRRFEANNALNAEI